MKTPDYTPLTHEEYVIAKKHLEDRDFILGSAKIEFRALGLKYSMWILELLMIHRELSTMDIQAILGLERANTNSALKPLVLHEFIDDCDHKGYKVYSITKKGKELCQKLM
jgi:predicted transcriptional regulator